MPELPDVEVFRRHLAATSLHHEIARTSIPDPDLLDGVTHQALASRMKGKQLETTHRHGKYLFVKVSTGDWLVLHFGMTGTLAHLGRDEEPPQHTRMLIEFTSRDRLAYTCQRKLGRIGWTDHWESFVRDHQLGPDALQVDWTSFRDRLSEKRGTLKGALMDQSVIAGIGNVYSDEILFQCRWHPQVRVDQLDESQTRELYRTTGRVLDEAIASGARPEEMPETFLLPHRDGRCPRCGEPVQKISVSGRNAVYCPKCQSK